MREVGGALISGKVARRGKSLRRFSGGPTDGRERRRRRVVLPASVLGPAGVEETLNMAGGGSVYTALVRSVSEVRQHLP